MKKLKDIALNASPLQEKGLIYNLVDQHVKTLSSKNLRANLHEIHLKGQEKKDTQLVFKLDAQEDLVACAKKFIGYGHGDTCLINSLLEHILSRKDNPIDNNMRSLFTSLEIQLYTLANSTESTPDHIPFVKSICPIKVINDDKSINLREGLPKFSKWEKETLYFIQERETAVWFSLDQLLAIHERHNARYHDELVENLSKDGVNPYPLQAEHHKAMGYIYLNTASKPTFLPSIEECKFHMNNIINALDTPFVFYDHKEGTLTIDNKQIDFEERGDTRTIISMLFSKKGIPNKKIIEYEKARDKIVEKNGEQKEPNIYDICRSIKKSLGNHGFADFLIFIGAIIKINSKYL